MSVTFIIAEILGGIYAGRALTRAAFEVNNSHRAVKRVFNIPTIEMAAGTTLLSSTVLRPLEFGRSICYEVLNDSFVGS